MDSGKALTLATLARSGREGMAACVDHSAAATRRSEDPMGLDRVHPCGDIADRVGNCPTFKSEPMAKRRAAAARPWELATAESDPLPGQANRNRRGKPLSRRVQAAAGRSLRLACAAS